MHRAVTTSLGSGPRASLDCYNSIKYRETIILHQAQAIEKLSKSKILFLAYTRLALALTLANYQVPEASKGKMGKIFNLMFARKLQALFAIC